MFFILLFCRLEAVVEPWLDDLYSAIGKEMKQQKLNPIQEGANNVALSGTTKVALNGTTKVALNGATSESEKNIANLVNKVDTLHLRTIGINDDSADKSSSITLVPMRERVVDGKVVESLTHSLPPLSEADLILPPVPLRFIQSDVVTEPTETMVCY